jgi:hypothetical protein
LAERHGQEIFSTSTERGLEGVEVRSKLPIRLTYANVVASLALFAALGGVSYAAGVLPKNSVGTAQLQKKAVSRAKLKSNAVTGPKVKNGSLQAADFKAGQLPAGAQGAKGDRGATGSPGLSGLEIVENTATGGNANQTVTALCPAGKRAIAASGEVDTAGAADIGEVALEYAKVVEAQVGSQLFSGGSAYAEVIKGNSVPDWNLTASVTCANVG